MKEVRTFAPDAQFKVLRSRVHVVWEVSAQGKTFKVTCSSSPKNEDHMILNVCRDVKRKLGL